MTARVVILAQDFDSYSTRRLADVLTARGHQVTLVSPLDCLIRLDADGSEVLHESGSLQGADLALLRCASFRTFGRTVVRTLEASIAMQLQLTGTRCVNAPRAKLLAHDKFLSLQVLHHAGLPVPTTVLSWDTRQLEQVIGQDLGVPLVLKTNEGTWGVGVMRAESLVAALSVIETLQGMDRIVLAQEYVSEAAGQDIRAIVVGNEVVGAFRRTARPGEFRSNIHRGATPELVRLAPEYQQVAVAATHTLGLELAGVDLLETEAGPLVLEVNPAPGWQQIERLSDVDVAARVVDYLTSQVTTLTMSH